MQETRSSLLVLLGDPGNAEAWEEFVSLYTPPLMAFLRKRGLDKHEADELVQDILVQLLVKLREFQLDRGRGRFQSWLFKVAFHALINKARKEIRSKRAEGRWHQRLLAADRSESRRWESELNQLHREEVFKRALEVARAKTRPKTWACFEEHILKGRTGGEVAAELELGVNAVYVNASRVLGQIRQWCADHLEEIVDEGPDRMPAR